MQKKATRLLTLVLAVVMLVSLLTVFGAAANVKHFDTYTVLGDSIAAGYGLDTYPVPEPRMLDGTRVEGSYPDLVGKAVTCKTYHNCSHCGNRAIDINWLVDPEAELDLLTFYFLCSALSEELGLSDLDLTKPEDAAAAAVALEGKRVETQKFVADADLITVNCGSNDTLTYAFWRYAMAHAEDDPTEAASRQEFIARISKLPLIGSTIQSLSQMGETLKFASELLQYMQEGQEIFKEYWDKMITAIRKLNPDATIVAVGMYNPFQTVTLTSGSMLPVGKAASLSIETMNAYIRDQSAQKGEYIFVYAPDPEVHEMPPLIDDQGSITPFIDGLRHGTHPTAKGHAYIADKIIEALTEDGSQPALPFKDVKEGSWYYDHVKYCYDNGLMEGMTKDTFAPLSNTTRAQFATVLWRLAGKEPPKGDNPFTDCQKHWAKDAITWAYENEIVNGMDAKTFAPNDNVTREQMVAMLYRYMKNPAVTGDLSAFKDAGSVSGYAVNAFIWATQNGIVEGRTADTLAPKEFATRAELATILHRFDLMLKAADAAA